MFDQEMLNCLYPIKINDESYKSDERQSKTDKEDYSNEQFEETNGNNSREFNSRELDDQNSKSLLDDKFL